MQFTSDDTKILEKTLKTAAVFTTLATLTAILSPQMLRPFTSFAAIFIAMHVMHDIGEKNRPVANVTTKLSATAQRLIGNTAQAQKQNEIIIFRNMINGGASIFDSSKRIATVDFPALLENMKQKP